MRRRPKRHDHLKRLYREELATQAAANQIPSTDSGEPTAQTAASPLAAAGVLTPTEQRWLKRDLLRSVLVVLFLLTLIILLTVYQNQSSIVGFTAKVAHWGGF